MNNQEFTIDFPSMNYNNSVMGQHGPTPMNQNSYNFQSHEMLNFQHKITTANFHQSNLPQNVMIESPPMDNIPPWQKNRQFYPQINDSFMAMSSYLDDRSAETPAPIPLECQLGPETPSPSLPSSSPPVDTADLLRLAFSDDVTDNSSTRKRRKSNEPQQPAIKRHRRTKAEIIQERNQKLIAQSQHCKVHIVQIAYAPVTRVFVNPSGRYILRTNLPRVPRMKIVSRQFQRIVDFGFMRTQNGLTLSCLTETCKFKTNDPAKFQRHVKSFHESKEPRMKCCAICKHVINGQSPLFELDHLLRVHVIQVGLENIPLEPIFHSRISKREFETIDGSEDEATGVTVDAVAIKKADSDLIEPKIEADLDTPIDSPESVKTEIMFDEETLLLLDVAHEACFNDSVEADQVADLAEPEPNVHSEAEKAENPIASAAKDPDFDPNEHEESDDDTISKISSSNFSTDDDESLEKASTSSSDGTDEPLVKIRKRLRAVSNKKYEETSDERRCRRSKRKVKKSERALKWRELCESQRRKRKGAKQLDSQLSDSSSPSSDDQPIAKQFGSARRKPSSLNSSLETPKSTLLLADQQKISSDVSSQEITVKHKQLRALSPDASSSEEKIQSEICIAKKEIQGVVPMNADLEIESEEATSSEKPEDIAPATPHVEPVDPAKDIKKLTNFLSPEMMKRILESRTQTNHTKLPVHLKTALANIEKSPNLPKTSSKATEPLADEPLREKPTNPVNHSEVNESNKSPIPEAQEGTATEAGEDVISEPSDLPRRSLEVKQQPTARKRARRRSRAQDNLFEFHGIKKCRVTVKRLTNEQLSKLLIENASNPELACVKVVPVRTSSDQSKGSNNIEPTLSVALPESSERQEDIFFDSHEFLDSQPLLNAPAKIPKDGETSETPTLELMESPPLESVEEEVFEDPACEKRVNLSALYPWIDDDVSRKCFKAESYAAALLTEPCLFSTYKCMSVECSFFTTDLKKFEKHIETHRNIDPFFICSYCLLQEKYPDDLVYHIKENHEYDRYQCGSCMYRSCEKFYCHLHRRLFHPKKSTPIFKSPVQPLLKDTRSGIKKKLERNIVNLVKLISCKLCSRKFESLQDYNEHLQEEADDQEYSEEKVDIICEEQMRIQLETAKELEVCDYGFYQCAYCNDAFNKYDPIAEHMSIVHPGMFAFICKRKRDPKFEPDGNTEVIDSRSNIHVFDLVDKAQMKRIKSKLWNDELEKLTGSDAIMMPKVDSKIDRNSSNGGGSGLLILDAYSVPTEKF